MRIDRCYVGCEREALKSAFGFKGSALTYLLQSAAAIYDGETVGVGEGVQSVLWSDADIFHSYGEDRGNEMMLDITNHAARVLCGREFDTPFEANEYLIAQCLAYAREHICETVSETFILNALVPIDLALWQLYARERGITSFDGIMPGAPHAGAVAGIPLITYNTPLREVRARAAAGTPIFKIKIGADPDKDGDRDKMLRADIARICAIHELLSNWETPYTDSGRIVYYLDANGRYDTYWRLYELIEQLDGRGILPQVVLFEEPFPERYEISVSDLPVCFAADESIHTLSDLKRRIELGYGAITQKSIAKTLSFSLKAERLAREAGVQCFAADLTVNPTMLEWNVNFGARLAPIRGMKIAAVESNGAENYTGWDRMRTYLPDGALDPSGAVYTLSEDFYKKCGAFEVPRHYLDLCLGGKRYDL